MDLWLNVFLLHLLAYSGGVTFYLIKDLQIKTREHWERCKLYPYTNNFVRIWTTGIIYSMRNLGLTMAFLWFFFCFFSARVSIGWDFGTVWSLIHNLIDHYLFTESYFYWVHRWLHHWGYRWHKWHHRELFIV